jgi:hypothetical protein
MNTLKYLIKTFPSWTKGSWEDGRVLLVYSERNPRKWLHEKKIKKDILKLPKRKVNFIESVKILCINDTIKSCVFWKRYATGNFYLQVLFQLLKNN